LAAALTHNRVVRDVDVRGNALGDLGACAIAICLGNQLDCVVRRLHLSHNNITDSGASSISEMLAFNQSLVHVDLSNNAIGPAGAMEIAQALETNNTITQLNITNNPIGDEGAMAFFQAIKHNPRLRRKPCQILY